MAIDPGLSLAAQVPQVQQPDLLRTMVVASQMRAQQQQEQMQLMQLADLVRRQREQQALSHYVTQGAQGVQPGQTRNPLLADTVPQAPFGTYARAPQASPTYAYDQLSPATQAPPGTTYTTAPAEMQPRAVAAPPLPGIAAQTPQPGMPTFDWQGAVRAGANPMDALQMQEVLRKARAGDVKAQEDAMEFRLKQVDYAQRILGIPNDQASLDRVRTHLQGQGMEDLAQILPAQYDKDAIDRIQMRLSPVKDRLQRMQTGLTPVWGTDASGKPVLMQMNQSGQAIQTQLPPGVTPSPGVQKMDLGTSIGLYDQRTGQPIRTEPKDVYGEAADKAKGKETGEYAGKRPELARKVQEDIAQIEQRATLLNRDVDRVLTAMDEGVLPTTGNLGALWGSVNKESPAGRVKTNLDSIKARIGIDMLQSIRDMSKTGGALGQVTEGEHRLLSSLLGNIQQAQNAEDLRTNLQDLKQFLTEARQRRKDAYERDFAGAVEELPRRGASAGKTIISKDRAQRLFQQLPVGVTPEMAIEQWRSKGIEVEQ